jgi:hypothetical protein
MSAMYAFLETATYKPGIEQLKNAQQQISH